MSCILFFFEMYRRQGCRDVMKYELPHIEKTGKLVMLLVNFENNKIIFVTIIPLCSYIHG